MFFKKLVKIKKKLSYFVKKKIGKDFVFLQVYPMVFKFYSHRKINKKLVLLITSQYEEIPDNLAYVKNEMEKRGYTCLTFLKLHRISKKRRHRLRHYLASLKQNLKFQKYYAQSAFCFLTDNSYEVDANKPRAGTQVIQLWHACGALKKFGYSTVATKWGSSLATLQKYRFYSSITAAMVSSEKIVSNYAEAFNLPEQIVHPFGAPRTDIFFDQDFVKSAPDKLREIFPQIGNRKIILYAPTFRGNSLARSYYVKMLDYIMMKRLLGTDYVLITKLHPLTAQKAKLTVLEKELYGDFVFDGSSRLDINTALCAADILISDYSTVMCEYSLLNRPMIFFAYDLEQYDRDRSFYYEYRDFVPGPIVADSLELVEAIRNTENSFDNTAIICFKNDFMNGCDGHSTERIVNFVISHSEHSK